MGTMHKITCPKCEKKRYPEQMRPQEDTTAICLYCVGKRTREQNRIAQTAAEHATMSKRQQAVELKKADIKQKETQWQEKVVAAESEAEAAAAEKASEAAAIDAASEAETPEPTLSPNEELAARALAHKHLLPFTMRFNPVYEPGWVHKDICQRLERFAQAVKDKQSPRLMLFMPPRHGKSELASRNFPAWYLGHNPQHEIIACSYSSSLAVKFSKKARAIMKDSLFTTVFDDVTVDKENESSEGWLTYQGGGYMPAGVGGPITGNGAHVLIIDDPVKNREDAESAVVRETVKDWYSSTAITRLAPGGGVLVILTRWHEDDLAGYLLEQERKGNSDYPWEVIRYPAIAEENETFRKQGEALHPGRFPIKSLEARKRILIPRDWNALYQQRPVADDGDYFIKKMFKAYQHIPDTSRVTHYTAWDLAIGQKQTNDWSVGITVAVDQHDDIYVVDCQRGRWDSYELVERILDTFVTFQSEMTGIEEGMIKMAMGPHLDKRVDERKLYNFYYEGLKPGRSDKVARARSIQGRMRQGKVYFDHEAPYFGELHNEMLKFPVGRHDDQVDAMAWIGLLLQEMLAPSEVKEAPRPGWRDKLAKFSRTGNRGGGFMSA